MCEMFIDTWATSHRGRYPLRFNRLAIETPMWLSRLLDVLSWRRGTGPATSRPFDPQAAAALREDVDAKTLLRLGMVVVNGAFRFTELGDSLVALARR